MAERPQLSMLTLDERAALDGAEVEVDHVYHDEVVAFHGARTAALAVAAAEAATAETETEVDDDGDD